MSLALEEHRHYLADATRLAAFTRAVGAVVRRGDRVLDLASGSGILGFLACQAGASRVYAVDHSPAIQLGRELARANGLADRITFIREFSTRAVLPERADVLLFDQLGPMGYEAGAFEFGRDARQRLLVADARAIPFAVDICVAGVSCDALRERLGFWSGAVAGIDLSALKATAINTVYTTGDEPMQRLSDAGIAASRPLAADDEASIRAEVRLRVRSAGRLDGLCGWFVAHLAPGISMTNEPGAAGRIARQAALLPLDPPVDVAPGDDLLVKLMIRPGEDQIAWGVDLVDKEGRVGSRRRHSSFLGLLIPEESLATANPAWRPRLTPLGEANRAVLARCDGTVALGEIEREVFARHAAILRTPAAAAAFVHDVLAATCR